MSLEQRIGRLEDRISIKGKKDQGEENNYGGIDPLLADPRTRAATLALLAAIDSGEGNLTEPTTVDQMLNDPRTRGPALRLLDAIASCEADDSEQLKQRS
jgi:hypothetical protein